MVFDCLAKALRVDRHKLLKGTDLLIKLFDEIKDVIIKTCISAEPVMLDIHSKTQEKRTCGF
jgi:hypothetical protein